MVNDPSARPPSGKGRLWTDPRESEEAQPWLKPRTPIVVAPPPAGDPGPGEDPRAARRRFYRNALVAAMAIFALIGAGFLGDSLLGDDGTAQTAALKALPGAAPADERSRSIRAVYASASPSVVNVRVDQSVGSATGTGFLVAGTDRGTIVTNFHVVGNATRAQVSLDDNSRLIDATVVGTDPGSDLAVLKVDPSAVAGRAALALADSDKVQVGDLAVAIGYPLGGGRSTTAGIVSAVGRSIPAPSRTTPSTMPSNFAIDEVIQTDAPINPGNSGGPLLDSLGRVIGVNSQIKTAGAGGGNVGIGFAVPSNTVGKIVPRLARGETIRRPYLGVSTEPAPVGTGARVGDVVGSAPADAAGLRVGDVITKIDGKDVKAPGDVSDAIDDRQPGDRVSIEVRRGGSTQTLSARLGTRPQGSP